MPGLLYPIPHLPMLGKGSILFDVFDASGNPTGSQHLGNCTKLELDIKDDIATLFQSINKSVSLIASALKKREPSVSITGTDFSAQHMAIVMMAAGIVSVVGTATPVTGEALVGATPTKKGKFFRTLALNLDVSLPANTVVHQGVTTLVQGVDYTIADPQLGLIYFPLTSAVVDTSAVTIDYKPLAATNNVVQGATQPYIKGKLTFDPDPTDGQKIALDIWNVNLNPGGALGMIADDYGNWTLKGMILDDTAHHPSAPYFQATFF
jgi:hypothetical protein